jgi:hypothetical protein
LTVRGDITVETLSSSTMLTLHSQLYLTKSWKTSNAILNPVNYVWKRWKMIVVYQQWQATRVWQLGWKLLRIIADDIATPICHIANLSSL